MEMDLVTSILGMMTCHPEIGFVDNNEDCDDGNEFVSPDGTEICDGIDNDCDGSIDQSPTPNNAPPSSMFQQSLLP